MRPPWYWRRRPLMLSPLAGVAAGEPPCVVHLVRAVNGIELMRRFADAMRAYDPGIECELVFAMKGFSSHAEAAPYIAEVADLAPKFEFFPDRGFDLGLYLAAAARLRCGRYCFVNSYTRPAVDGWLAKLDTALSPAGVGMVGATGSWQSSHSWLTYLLGLPSFYRGVLPPVRAVREELREIHIEHAGADSLSGLASLRNRLGLLPRLPEELLGCEPFPTPHLRTSTIMVSHAVLSRMRLFVVRNKMDAYALESGPWSFTRQVQLMGLSTLVVDRAGTAYEPRDWPRSQTYCQGMQEGLLAIDNRTDSYALGGPMRRVVLSGFAWGERADPQPPLESPAG